MKKLIFLFLALLNFAHGEIELELSPVEPIVGDSFNVYFKIKGDSAEEPRISFDPIGIEVLGRSNQGTSTRSTYINGKFSVEREVVYSYEMVANSRGLKFLKNIEVEYGGQKLTHKNFSFRVLDKPRVQPKVFAKAVVDKEQAFVGESIIVRYYLYYRTNVTNYDIRKFPKLSKFVKRYIQESSRSERVGVGNRIYTRNLIYTAQLYAHKPGKVTVDRMRLAVQYADRRTQSPFGGFGGFGRKVRKKTLSSDPVQIEILPLPTENVPKSFTGLIGKHEFAFKINKDKFLVNEPVEMKLTVTGKGSLESYEAPNILESSAFEEFETGGDLKLNPDFTATKTFQYTYLARNSANLPAKKYPVSYFDPESMQYVTDYLDIPAIKVKGGNYAGTPTQNIDSGVSENNSVNKDQISRPEKQIEIAEKTFVAPIFRYSVLVKNYWSVVNIFLALIVMIFLGFIFWQNRFYFSGRAGEIYLLHQKLKKEMDYSALHQLLSFLPTANPGIGLIQKIKESSLSKASQTYFINGLLELEKSKFSKDSPDYQLKYREKAFKELIKLIERSNFSSRGEFKQL